VNPSTSLGLRLTALRRPVLLLLTLAAFLAIGRVLPIGDWLVASSSYLRHTGSIGIVGFILAYTVGAFLFVPAAMFTFVAGFSLGAGYGVLVAIPGIATSSFLVFLLARTLLRKNVEGWLSRDPRFLVLDRLLARLGPRAVVLLRFSPISPFSILNYAFGLTGIPKRHYLVATCIGTIPGSIFFAQLGAVAPHLGCIAEGRLPDGGLAQTIMLLVGLVLTALVGLWLAVIAKRALHDAEMPKDTPSSPPEEPHPIEG
jgi:uncharacterized membrane protein YdjX (TVP38/TMEM64 family)